MSKSSCALVVVGSVTLMAGCVETQTEYYAPRYQTARVSASNFQPSPWSYPNYYNSRNSYFHSGSYYWGGQGASNGYGGHPARW